MIQARNLVPAIGDYSTSEQDTGFTWIDGKSIFKKTIVSTLSGTENAVSPNVTPGIDTLIDWKNTIVTSNTRQHVVNFRTGSNPNDFPSAQTYYMNATQFNKDTGQLKFEFGSQYSPSKTVYTTIWYTKKS